MCNRSVCLLISTFHMCTEILVATAVDPTEIGSRKESDVADLTARSMRPALLFLRIAQ